MRLSICGISELPKYANSGVTHVLSLVDAEFTDVVSQNGHIPDIVHNANHLFESYQEQFDRLELQFDDVSQECPFGQYQAATSQDVERILEFGRNMPDDPKLLIHCHAGVSRSTAAATLILMQRYPDDSILNIFDKLIEVRPQAYPNTLILSLGAEILNRSWEMKTAYRERFGGR